MVEQGAIAKTQQKNSTTASLSNANPRTTYFSIFNIN